MTLDNRAWLRRRRVVDLMFAGCLRCLALVGTCTPALAADIPLTDSTVLRFADVREGTEALTKRDDYIAAAEPLRSPGAAQDRSRCLRTGIAGLHSAARAALDAGEIEALLTPLIESMARKLEPGSSICRR